MVHSYELTRSHRRLRLIDEESISKHHPKSENEGHSSTNSAAVFANATAATIAATATNAGSANARPLFRRKLRFPFRFDGKYLSSHDRKLHQCQLRRGTRRRKKGLHRHAGTGVLSTMAADSIVLSRWTTFWDTRYLSFTVSRSPTLIICSFLMIRFAR